MQEFLKNINLYDSGGIPPYFQNSGGNSVKKSPENIRNSNHSGDLNGA
jgi:hypothetical protein